MVTPLEPDDPRVLGEFRLSGRLGEGGQGVVYLGHTPAGAPVAVKVLKTGLGPAVRERLNRELDAMRGVAPFCTARVVTAVVEGRQPYVVSEFIDGPSLQQRVSSGGPLRDGDLVRLAVGTATALTAIHAAGIVHRDFKPGNVLLGPDGPRVVDFGIARQDGSETMTSGPIGTPAYLAPEQLAGQPAGPASDVFAWGATIAFAALGRAAFGADSVGAVLHRIMTSHPDLSAIPPPLRQVVDRCLAKDPAARPVARDLLLELVGSAPDPLRAGAAAAKAPMPSGPPTPSRSAMASGPAMPAHPSWPPTGPQPAHPGPHPGTHPTAPPAAMDTGPGRQAGAVTTHPGADRRGRRTRALAGVAAGVAALGVTAALLVPRLLTSPGTTPSVSPGTGQQTKAAATSTAPTASPTDSYEQTTPSPEPSPDGATEAPGGTRIPAAFAGRWRGHIVPTPAIVMSESDIEIVLVAGDDRGVWKEPANSCEGRLRLDRVHPSALSFRLEQAGQCVPGTITLTRKGDGLRYRWNDDAGLLTYDGDLAKA
ncbi:protein kinase [Microbispora sp. NPDC049125]|uniref:serine/threonine-protein kinase n=1 Tax=Microbispora sp. NPDC049125 TaxID=3154929 RepID=UPI003465E64E